MKLSTKKPDQVINKLLDINKSRLHNINQSINQSIRLVESNQSIGLPDIL